MIALCAALLVAALRIVSLAPSLTEDLFAIGAGANVVGVDLYSNRPAAAARLPKVGALAGVSAERIIALRPTLVVGIAYQAPILAQLQSLGIRSESFNVDSLDDVFTTLDRLGEAARRRAEARSTEQSMHASLRRISARAAKLSHASAFAVIGTQPIYTAGRGSFIDGLFSLANLNNVAVGGRAPWIAYSAERLRFDDPRMLVLPSDVELPAAAPWTDLRAVGNGCILRVPADDLLRPGPRIAAMLQRIVDQRLALGRRCE